MKGGLTRRTQDNVSNQKSKFRKEKTHAQPMRFDRESGRRPRFPLHPGRTGDHPFQHHLQIINEKERPKLDQGQLLREAGGDRIVSSLQGRQDRRGGSPGPKQVDHG